MLLTCRLSLYLSPLSLPLINIAKMLLEGALHSVRQKLKAESEASRQQQHQSQQQGGALTAGDMERLKRHQHLLEQELAFVKSHLSNSAAVSITMERKKCLRCYTCSHEGLLEVFSRLPSGNLVHWSAKVLTYWRSMHELLQLEMCIMFLSKALNNFLEIGGRREREHAPGTRARATEAESAHGPEARDQFASTQLGQPRA